MAEFEEHVLVSTGKDERVKLWRKGELIADWNVNVLIRLFLVAFAISVGSESVGRKSCGEEVYVGSGDHPIDL